MVLFLIDFLRNVLGLKVPMAFEHYSTRMMVALISALVLTIFLGPRFIKKLYEMKIGQTIRTEDCPFLAQLHQKKKDTPTMGGTLLLFSMLVSMLLWMDLTHVFTLMLFATTVLFGCLGASDDYLKLKYKNSKGVSGRVKMAVQCVLGAAIAFYLIVPGAASSIAIGKWFQPPVVKEHTSAKQDKKEAPERRSHGDGASFQANYAAGLCFQSICAVFKRISVCLFRSFWGVNFLIHHRGDHWVV